MLSWQFVGSLEDFKFSNLCHEGYDLLINLGSVGDFWFLICAIISQCDAHQGVK